jgi:hypothetical protein
VFSAVGSFIAPMFMYWFGPSGLFVFSTLCLTGFAAILTVRRRIHVLPLLDETEPFRAVAPTATPMALELDPRTDEHPDFPYEAEEGAT